MVEVVEVEDSMDGGRPQSKKTEREEPKQEMESRMWMSIMSER